MRRPQRAAGPPHHGFDTSVDPAAAPGDGVPTARCGMDVPRSGGRLADPRDLRAALGLTCVPDDTTPDRVLRQLDDAVMAPALTAALHQLPAPPEERGTAVDATGGASGARMVE